MGDVRLESGFSYYKGRCISDLQICNLVGLETYKALYQLFPSCWVSVTNPMTACEKHLYKIRIILSLNETNLEGECLKRRLIRRYVDGPSKRSSSELVAGLIGSSDPLEIPNMSCSTYAMWILWIFIMILLIVFVVALYVWPDIRDTHATIEEKFVFRLWGRS